MIVQSPTRSRRVLCYSPYLMWALHGLWEGTVLHGLRHRGVEVLQILCDSQFTDCDLFWGAVRARDNYSCLNCQAQATQVTCTMGLPFHWLGRYLEPRDHDDVRCWVSALRDRQLADATFGDWRVGNWVKSSVHSHFRDSSLRLDDGPVAEVYRSYLLSGALACRGLVRAFDAFSPHCLFLFNGRMSTTRVALELARSRGIRVVTHERGPLRGQVKLVVGDHCLSQDPVDRMWSRWREVPLTDDELAAVGRTLKEREMGQGMNWRSFSPPLDRNRDTLAQLGLRSDVPLLSLFTSSDDEVAAFVEGRTAFPCQLSWVRAAVEYAAGHRELSLVIRVHPNTAGSQALGDNRRQLEEFLQLREAMPANVRMVMPDDPVSTYSLIERSAVGLVYSSTVGLEMAARGKSVVVAGPGACCVARPGGLT